MADLTWSNASPPQTPDTAYVRDPGNVDLVGPSKVSENIQKALGSFVDDGDDFAVTEDIAKSHNLVKTLSEALSCVEYLSREPQWIGYEDVAISDLGSIDLTGPMKVREYVIPDLADPPYQTNLTRLVIDEIHGADSTSFARITDWIYVYDNVGQSNPLAVREWIQANLAGPSDRARLVYDLIPVSEDVATSVYDFDLSQELNDVVSSFSIPTPDYLTPELLDTKDDTASVVDSVSRNLSGLIHDSGTPVVVTDRPVPYLSEHKSFNRITPDLAYVRDVATPRYSALYVSIYDKVETAESTPSRGNGREDNQFRYRLRY